ncbi:hypothetical protein LT330_001869 [Penicillium expansum]|nr:hypothetical protein LT330_001869 [Penicillium expansum]
MSSENQEYSVDQGIANFFQKTSVDRSSCDDRARKLVGGTVTPVAVQGASSYSVYAGPNHEYVVQFRLRSLWLKTEIVNIASKIYGSLVPSVACYGQIGRDVSGKERLSLYVMSRVKGIRHLDFVNTHNLPENSPEYFTWRENLISDVASLTWKTSLNVDASFRENLYQRYDEDLRLLLAALPNRFHAIIQQSIDTLPAIFSLPMVLLHKDFGMRNVMVDADNNHLIGIIDWAEAEIGPFGTNLHCLQQFMSKYRLGVGWIRYRNYDTLNNNFWKILSVGAGLEEETIRTIKSAMIVGLLLSHGFTSRLANMPKPEPIRDDESGAYEMLGLDSLLIAPATKLVD